MPAQPVAAHDHPTLRQEERAAIADELQNVLATLIGLSLAGKHAHWNVVGPNFRSLHLQLDEMTDAWRDAADQVAERVRALGFAPDGRAQTIASDATPSEVPAGPIIDSEVIAAFTALLADAVRGIRERMDRLETGDAVTADILHGVVAGLEENLWMVRVQAP